MAPMNKNTGYSRLTLHAYLRKAFSITWTAALSSKLERKDSEAKPKFNWSLSQAQASGFGAIIIAAAFILTAFSFGPSAPVQAQAGKGGNSDALLEPDASIEVGNTIYRVLVNTTAPAVGKYTAVTGQNHPAGPGRQVLFGTTPGTSFNSIRSFTSGKTYVQGETLQGAVNLDAYAQPSTTTANSVENRWVLPGDATAPDKLEITQTITVVGSTIGDSMILIQTTVKNNGAAPVSIGIRYLWDYQINFDDGPTFQEQSPNGLVRLNEAEFTLPAFATYKMTNNEGTPVFNILGSAASGGTQPDKLQYASWPAARDTAFDYTVTGQNVASAGGVNDSAVLYYWNRTLPAGGSASVTATLLRLEPAVCTITCPPNITKSNDLNQCGAVVNYTVTINSGCSSFTCSPASGTFFPIGVTTVNCTATPVPTPTNEPLAPDATTCSFTVTVVDSQPPSITCPANITRSVDAGQCSAVVNYPNITISDNCPGVTASCTPPSGSSFPRGVTTVTCTAKDANSNGPPNMASCSFTVTVNADPIRISCPVNIDRQCPGPASFDLPTATGGCGTKTVNCSPSPDTVFPLGTTTINCVASDEVGTSSRCSFTLTVRDSMPPDIPPIPPQSVNANGACTGLIPDLISGLRVTDNCSPDSQVSVTQSIAKMTAVDAGIGTNAIPYTVTITATDRAGNQSFRTVTVNVLGASPASATFSSTTVELRSVKLFSAKKKKKKVKAAAENTTGEFTVNAGCAPVNLSLVGFRRATDAGKFRNDDDSAFFSVFKKGEENNPNANLIGKQAVLIPKKGSQTFVVQFHPVIPAPAACVNNTCLSASDVLPDDFLSKLIVNDGSDKEITIHARTDAGVKLIDPANPSSANSAVTICRSGDEFTVTYYVYDSSKADVKNVKYEFLDSSDKAIKVIDNVDLGAAIAKTALVNGQSFKVDHPFSGADDNSDVAKVKITVTGAGGSTVSATSSGVSSSCGTRVQSLWEAQGVTVSLPARRLGGLQP
jgi:HYR domain